MRVAVVDEWIPFPVDNGKKLRSYNLLAPLAQHHKITYISPRSCDPERDRIGEMELRDRGIDVVWADQIVPADSGPRFAYRLAANLGSSLPYSVQRHCNRSLQKAIRTVASDEKIDLWHVEWTPYVHNLRGNVAGSWVINAHNIESQIWKRHWEAERNPLRAWYIHKQWKKYELFERSAFREAQCVITTTELDAETARSQFGIQRVATVDNGVDLSRFRYTSEERDPHELLFLGSLSWRPNLVAAKDLLERIFPAILAVESKARLTIVGANPPSWLAEKVQGTRQTTLHENVPDVRPYLARCGALVVPLSIGGGSRIKILEALASGCPVISTEIGAEGLHLSPDVDYVLVKAHEDFATATVEAMRNRSQLQETAAEGSKIVRSNYRWDKLSQELARIWESTMAIPPNRHRVTTAVTS